MTTAGTAPISPADDTGRGDLAGLLAALEPALRAGDLLAAERLIARADPQLSPPLLHAALTFMQSRVVNNDRLHAFGTRPDGSGGELSFLPLPVGFMSGDRSALLGRAGYLFLIGGSNDVIGQYTMPSATAQGFAASWSQLLLARSEEATKRGLRYHQVIIPEKISILPELFPVAVTTPTRTLANIEEQIASAGLSQSYTSGRAALCAPGRDPMAFCKKLDSHLSPAGAFVVFQALLRDVYGLAVAEFEFGEKARAVGDLSFRMLGMHVTEEFEQVALARLPDFTNRIVKREEQKPALGAHLGYRQVWLNLDAPIQQKVVVFGNSFFSAVENGQSTLSWWFARWFSEYHFVWTNEVEWDYVDEVEPDLVIWQGIERFLPIVPLT